MTENEVIYYTEAGDTRGSWRQVGGSSDAHFNGERQSSHGTL